MEETDTGMHTKLIVIDDGTDRNLKYYEFPEEDHEGVVKVCDEIVDRLRNRSKWWQPRDNRVLPRYIRYNYIEFADEIPFDVYDISVDQFVDQIYEIRENSIISGGLRRFGE